MAELDDKVIVTKDKITTIADTIREEGGTSDLMTLDEMPDNIRAISGGGGNADVISPLYYKEGSAMSSNPWKCTKTFAELNQYIPSGNMADAYAKSVIPQVVGDFGAYDRYACYYISNTGSEITYRFRKWYTNGNLEKYNEIIIKHNSNDVITYSLSSGEMQKKLTAGTGISINANGVISLNLAQAEGGGF